MTMISADPDSLVGRKQMMIQQGRSSKQLESFSMEMLKKNIPASAMVNPYINRLVKIKTWVVFGL